MRHLRSACRWFALPVLLFTVLAATAAPVLRVTGAERVVAFADVHGAYAELVSLLRETAVVDDGLRWQGGKTQLVSLGDLLDRGPDSRKVLDLLMRLETEAAAAGGAVHLVLGNHEVMNIVGDLRYVSAAEYDAFAGADDDALRAAAWQRVLARDPAALRADFDARFPPGYFAHRAAFSTTGRYGAWLLTRPFLITVNDTAFVHGGLSGMVANLGLEATNESLHAELAAYLAVLPPPEDQSSFRDAPRTEAVFTPTGPSWFRGQALCHPFTEQENLDAALAKLGVLRVVEGHTTTTTRRVTSRFDGRVIMLDAGMLAAEYQGRPAAFVFENGAWNARYPDRPGERLAPELPRRAVGLRPAGLDDDTLESWLQHAEVTGIEELDAGITQPQRVTLRRDGVELRAVFKQVSTDFGATSLKQKLDNADRFEYEIAAYRLDRLLGLDMVPVTVPRTLNGRRGILQFWVDGAMNLRTMLEQKLVPEGWCASEPQYNLMNAFDVLVHNTDRTQENALFTRDWTLVLIDHSRAFPTTQERPRLLYLGELRLPPAFALRLEALTREQLLQELGPWLHKRQIEALLKRRDRLLKEYRSGAPAKQAGAGS